MVKWDDQLDQLMRQAQVTDDWSPRAERLLDTALLLACGLVFGIITGLAIVGFLR